MSNDTGRTKERSGLSWEFVWIGPIILNGNIRIQKKLNSPSSSHPKNPKQTNKQKLEHLTLSVVNGLSQYQQYTPKCKLLADGIENSSRGALLNLQSTFPYFQIFFCCLPHAAALSASTLVNWFLSVIWRMVLLLSSLFTAQTLYYLSLSVLALQLLKRPFFFELRVKIFPQSVCFAFTLQHCFV